MRIFKTALVFVLAPLWFPAVLVGAIVYMALLPLWEVSEGFVDGYWGGER